MEHANDIKFKGIAYSGAPITGSRTYETHDIGQWYAFGVWCTSFLTPYICNDYFHSSQ